MVRSGSLCSGVGMLDRVVDNLFDADHNWHAETDPAASQVLKAHWPTVPNLGDITAVDWAGVDRVDVLSAGFPCQGFSLAGKRGGSADERHLWPVGVLPGIEALIPPVVVLENVPGLLTIERGAVFATILADLDGLGYSVAWTTIGACKLGACHHRHRLFVLAVRSGVVVPSTDPLATRRGDVWSPVQAVLFGDVEAVRWPASGVSRDGLVWSLPVDTCGTSGLLPTPTPTPTARDAKRGAGWGDQPGRPLSEVAAMLPTPTAGERRGRHTSPDVAARRMKSGRRNLDDAVALLPTPRVSAVRTGRSAILGSSSSPSLEQAFEIAAGELPRELRSWDEAPPSWTPLPTPTASPYGSNQSESVGSAVRLSLGATAKTLPPTSAVQPGRFGPYEFAVRRHELAFGTPAPDPTEPGRNGNPRLTAVFPEWMMGCPAGWITDVVGRADAIRGAGNGVFAPAAEFGFRSLPAFPAALVALAGQAVVA